MEAPTFFYSTGDMHGFITEVPHQVLRRVLQGRHPLAQPLPQVNGLLVTMHYPSDKFGLPCSLELKVVLLA